MRILLSIDPNPTAVILNVKTQDVVLEVSFFYSIGIQVGTKDINGQINVNSVLKANDVLKIITDQEKIHQETIFLILQQAIVLRLDGFFY